MGHPRSRYGVAVNMARMTFRGYNSRRSNSPDLEPEKQNDIVLVGQNMLEKLNEIPWASLTHAYGPANDVPALILALRSPDEEVRQETWTELYGNIWHQGTIYEATAYAVPFLVELLLDPSVQQKDWILGFLAEIANGTSYWDVHQHVPFIQHAQREQIASGQMADKIARELAWVKAARDAVNAGSPVYRALLKHNDNQIRMASAFLLSNFPDNLDALQAAYADEESGEVRAAEALALGDLGAGNHTVAKLLTETLTSSQSNLERVASAIALGKLAASVPLPAGILSTATRLLTATIEDSSSVADKFNAMPGIEAEIEDYCAQALEDFRLGQPPY
jgi:hypothetical protein